MTTGNGRLGFGYVGEIRYGRDMVCRFLSDMRMEREMQIMSSLFFQRHRINRA